GVDDLAAVLAERAAAGVPVLFSSHQLDLVEHLCDSVAIINRGRCVASGTVRDLEHGGRPHLAVEVAGDAAGAWAADLAGVTVVRNDNGRLRLALAPQADPEAIV